MSLTGPAGNIGDALIRRETLRWAMHTSDDLVVYVGDAPDAWLRQLGVPPDALVLRSKRSVTRWLWLLASAPRHPVLVFEAGEVPLDRGNGLREIVFLAETVLTRLKSGVVVRPPRGIRAPSDPARRLHSLGARASQFSLWRDAPSAALVGGRDVVPDIGFAAPAREGAPWSDRDELVVSLRGARPHPGTSWIRAVRDTAAREGLRIRTVVQVREDEDRSRELAVELGGEFEPWGETDAVLQEERLRRRYEAARLVVSDRLHVLVLAALSGAVPVELVPRPTGKITQAFATAGLHRVSSDVGDDDDMRRFLVSQLERAGEVRDRVEDAARRLAGIEQEIRERVRSIRA